MAEFRNVLLDARRSLWANRYLYLGKALLVRPQDLPCGRTKLIVVSVKRWISIG